MKRAEHRASPARVPRCAIIAAHGKRFTVDAPGRKGVVARRPFPNYRQALLYARAAVGLNGVVHDHVQETMQCLG